MRPSSRLLAAATAAFAAAGVLSPGSADAATVARQFFQNGGSACTGALPTFEGSLRKRPLAIANEGAVAAFITCSAQSNNANSARPTVVFAAANNRSGAAVTLSCTLVNGDGFNGTAFTPASIVLPVNELTTLQWLPAAPATQLPFASVSISCSLPPGVEVNYFGHDIAEDIGA